MSKTLLEKIVDEMPEVEKRAIDIRIDVAERILSAIDKRGITSKQLAELAGMKPAVLSRVINAATNWRAETIAKIEVALGENVLTVTSMPADSTFSTPFSVSGAIASAPVIFDMKYKPEESPPAEVATSERGVYYVTPGREIAA